MASNAQEHPRRIFRRILKLACACLLLVAALPYFPTCHPKPPDLTTCTRIEVRYAGGALNYFSFGFGPSMQQGVFNEEERQYIRSYDKWTVTDQGQIKAFASQLSQSTYQGRLPLVIWLFAETDPPTNIVGYKPGGRKISFSMYGAEAVVGRCRFTCSPRSLILGSLDPPGLRPLQARRVCGRHMSCLIYQGLWTGRQRVRPHLDPDRWCDTIVEHYRNRYTTRPDSNKRERWFPDTYIAKMFTCPGVHTSIDLDVHRQIPEIGSLDHTPDTWTSDYAMNSDCREDSPKDMVFLFESKPGWNQHGGPELFTFDNHDPRGGLVLLNDGTVKFIRTGQELKQLRWK